MTDLPDVQDIVGATTTEADFQAAMTALYDHVAESVGASAPEDLTIATGDITPTKGHVVVDTEAAAASDDLDHILPTNLGARMLILQNKIDTRSVVLKHAIAGTGKLTLQGAVDATLYHPDQMILLRYDVGTTAWVEVYRNFGIVAPNATVQATIRTNLGLSDAATKTIGVDAGEVPTVDLLGALAFKSSIDTAELVNTSVTTGKIVDNAVTLAKLAGGTAGKILGFDGSGDPAELDAPSASSGGLIDTQTFTASCTWTKPAGTNSVKVTVVGGGGGGGGNTGNGSGGGTSSFGAHCSATGGGGGGSIAQTSTSSYDGGSGGSGSSGDVNITGGGGGVGVENGSTSLQSGAGGDSSVGGGGQGLASGNTSANQGGVSGNQGGGGSGRLGNARMTSGGGGGGTALKHITSGLGSSETITVGSGGSGGGDGGSGGAGIVIVEAYT